MYRNKKYYMNYFGVSEITSLIECELKLLSLIGHFNKTNASITECINRVRTERLMKTSTFYKAKDGLIAKSILIEEETNKEQVKN